MFPRLNTIFASRWNAIWFAGMTMLLAYCSFGGDQPPGDGNAQAADARAAIAASEMSAEDKARAEDALNAIDSMTR